MGGARMESADRGQSLRIRQEFYLLFCRQRPPILHQTYLFVPHFCEQGNQAVVDVKLRPRYTGELDET